MLVSSLSTDRPRQVGTTAASEWANVKAEGGKARNSGKLTPLVTCDLSACTPPLTLPALHVLPLLALLTGVERPTWCCALPKPPICSFTICRGGNVSDDGGTP